MYLKNIMTTKEIITQKELIDEVARVCKILQEEVLDKPINCTEKVDFNSHLTHLPVIFKLYLDYSYDPELIAHAYGDEFLQDI